MDVQPPDAAAAASEPSLLGASGCIKSKMHQSAMDDVCSALVLKTPKECRHLVK